MIEAIVFSLIVLAACGGSFYLGHSLTMRSIAHVQPSANVVPVGSVHVGKDPFELDYGDEYNHPDDEKGHEDTESKLAGLGLDLSAMRGSMGGTSMSPVGAPVKGDISFINKSEGDVEAEEEGIEDDIT